MGLRAWQNRKLIEKKEDFSDMTDNVGTVLRAVAKGNPVALKDLKSVRTPIGGFRLGKEDDMAASSKFCIKCGKKRTDSLPGYTCPHCIPGILPGVADAYDNNKKPAKKRSKKRTAKQKRATAKMRRALVASKKSHVKFEPRFHKRGPGGGWRGIG